MRKMKSKSIFFLFLIISVSLIGLGNAQPPFAQQIGLTNGYAISIPQEGTIAQNNAYQFYFYVNNISNGYPIDNSSTLCYFHLSNSSGDHLFEAQVPHITTDVTNEWGILVNASNFSNVGTKTFKVECYSATTNLGGVGSVGLEVTPLGDTIGSAQSIFYIIILFVIIMLFGFFAYLSISTPFENDKEMTKDGIAITKVTKTKYVKLISFWIAFGLFMWIVTITSGIATNYIFFEGTRIMIRNLLTYLGYLSVGVNMGMGVLLFVLIWKDIILNKKILKNGRALLSEL